MKNLINWLKKTFEDSKGNPSSKRTTGFWVTVLFTICNLSYQFIIYEFASGKFPVNEYSITLLDANYYLCLLLAGFILLLFGVVTFESIKSFVRGNNTNVIIQEKETKVTEKTETTNDTQ